MTTDERNGRPSANITPTIITALAGLIGLLISSYLGYRAGVDSLRIPLAATQTAEARQISAMPTPNGASGGAAELILAQSTFDEGHDGWTPVAAGKTGITYAATNGNPSGFITIDDADGDSYWSAPEKFLGNKSAAYNGVLMFDLKPPAYYPPDNEIISSRLASLEGKGITLSSKAAYNPEGDWTTYTILLNEHGGWINEDTGQAATKAEIISVLGSLGKLLIRGEFIRGLEETGGLDNVLLIAHP